jgi:hypothetical protein
MPIRLRCETCGKGLIVRDELAGRKGRCPECNGVIEVPDAAGRRSESEAPAAPTVPKTPKGRDSASLAGLDFSEALPPLEWLVEGPEGKNLGPVDFPQVRQWVLDGMIPPSAKVKSPAMQSPREIRRVPDFQDTLQELQASKVHGPAHTIGTARIGKE